MFLPYSSDVFPEYRPWLAYVTFPAFVIFSFYLAAEGAFPEINRFLFLSFIEFGPFLLLLFMLGSFLVLWTLGKAVCCKIGNFRYVLGLFVLFVLFAGISWAADAQGIWFLSWFISGIAGVYLVFYPENSVDCFFVVPPFSGFSIAGYWLILFWLFVDFLFCLFLGWYLACLVHPLAFSTGLAYASLLLKVGRIRPHPDERTLWQAIRDRQPEERFWEESWSVRQKRARQEEPEEPKPAVRVQETASARSAPTAPEAENRADTAVLCPCGRVVYAAADAPAADLRCPACGHRIRRPGKLPGGLRK